MEPKKRERAPVTRVVPIVNAVSSSAARSLLLQGHKRRRLSCRELTHALVAKVDEVSRGQDGLDAIVPLVQAKASINGSLGNDTCLHIAAFNGRVDIMKLLLSLGANIHQTNPPYGNTPLHSAAMGNQCAAIKLLLDMRAEINAQSTRNQQTPLHCAAARGFEDVCEMLLARRAAVNMQSSYRQTALHLAVTSYHRRTRVVELLLARSADPCLVDTFGLSVLHAACGAGRVYLDVLEAIVRSPAINVNQVVPATQRNALHFLSQAESSASCFELLVDKGCNPLALDYNHKTPLELYNHRRDAPCSEDFKTMVASVVSVIGRMPPYVQDFTCSPFTCFSTDCTCLASTQTRGMARLGLRVRELVRQGRYQVLPPVLWNIVLEFAFPASRSPSLMTRAEMPHD